MTEQVFRYSSPLIRDGDDRDWFSVSQPPVYHHAHRSRNGRKAHSVAEDIFQATAQQTGLATHGALLVCLKDYVLALFPGFESASSTSAINTLLRGTFDWVRVCC